MQGEADLPDADSTALAADLVAEAVATFKEQHGDEQAPDPTMEPMPSATAHFPPLAKALVEGERVSLTTWRRCSRSTSSPARASPAS